MKNCVLWLLLLITCVGISKVVCQSDSDPQGKPGSKLQIQQAEETLPELDRRGDVREIVDKGLWPIYVMSTTFVGKAVQLHFLTYIDEKLGPFTSFEDIGNTFSEDWQEWIKYFLGFTICIAFGIVAFFAMLIAGLVWPCCRCCGKCGGKPDPVNKKNSAKQRMGCSITLVIINCILILGATAMFVLNERIEDQLIGENTVFDSISKNIEAVEPFLENSVDQINTTILQTYIKSKNQLFAELYNMPQTALQVFDEETQILQTYMDLKIFSFQLPNLNVMLDLVSNNSESLQDLSKEVNTTLETTKVDILNELDNCPTRIPDSDCWAAANKTEDLFVNVDYTIINVTTALRATQYALDNGFHRLIAKIGDDLANIKDDINSTTYMQIQEAEGEADEIQTGIADLINKLEKGIQDLNITQVTVYMDDAQKVVEDENIAVYTYWSIVGLCSTLCIIIVVNLIGLLHGAVCPAATESSKCTDCDGNQATRWLLTSSAFTFIFYWIYVLVVMLTFAVGGTVYTEFCRNVVYFNEPDAVGVLNIMDRLINDTLYEGTGVNLTVFDAYRQCERNATVYNAFRIAENGYNITEIADLSDVEKAIEDIKDMDIILPQVTFYTDDLSDILMLLDRGLMLDYTAMRAELEKTITTVNLTELANQLEALNISALAPSINILRDLEANQIKTMEALAQETIVYLDNIIATLGDLNFSSLGTSLNKTELLINNQGDMIVSKFIDDTADAVYNNITIITNNIIRDIENNVAQCRPLYDSVTAVIDSTCVSTLYPLNAFWFSLGWCIFFLIPYLILTIKLSNLYRKTIPYVKDFGDRDLGDDFQLQPVNSTDMRGHAAGYGMSEFDDFKAFDNLAFDPMHEYRRELSRQGSNVPALGANYSPPPSYPAIEANNPYVIPRPYMSKHKEDLLLPHYGGATPMVESSPLHQKVPLPTYGEAYSGDADLAYMY